MFKHRGYWLVIKKYKILIIWIMNFPWWMDWHKGTDKVGLLVCCIKNQSNCLFHLLDVYQTNLWFLESISLLYLQVGKLKVLCESFFKLKGIRLKLFIQEQVFIWVVILVLATLTTNQSIVNDLCIHRANYIAFFCKALIRIQIFLSLISLFVHTL